MQEGVQIPTVTDNLPVSVFNEPTGLMANG